MKFLWRKIRRNLIVMLVQILGLRHFHKDLKTASSRGGYSFVIHCIGRNWEFWKSLQYEGRFRLVYLSPCPIPLREYWMSESFLQWDPPHMLPTSWKLSLSLLSVWKFAGWQRRAGTQFQRKRLYRSYCSGKYKKYINFFWLHLFPPKVICSSKICSVIIRIVASKEMLRWLAIEIQSKVHRQIPLRIIFI